MKINVRDAYIKIILLFPLFTLFQKYLGAINKILFALLLFLQLYIFIKQGFNKKSLFLISCVIILELIALAITEFPIFSLNDIFYFPFIVFFLSFLCEKRNYFYQMLRKNDVFIRIIIYSWSFFIVISMVFRSSYKISWGQEVYFTSFSGDPFRLCPTAFFVLCLILFEVVVEKRKSMFWFSLIPMFCFFSSGTRTYFVVGLLLFLIVWYKFFKNKKKFWISLVPLVLLLIIIFVNSSLMNKVLATTYQKDSYFDFWGTITSGRTIFWEADISAFQDGDIFQKLFGFGFNYIYEINQNVIGAKIWAHNDFIQILISYGYFGIIIYLLLFLNFFRIKLKNNGQQKWIIGFVIIIWFFTACINMFYTYFCTVLGYAVLIECLNNQMQVTHMNKDILCH